MPTGCGHFARIPCNVHVHAARPQCLLAYCKETLAIQPLPNKKTEPSQFYLGQLAANGQRCQPNDRVIAIDPRPLPMPNRQHYCWPCLGRRRPTSLHLELGAPAVASTRFSATLASCSTLEKLLLAIMALSPTADLSPTASSQAHKHRRDRSGWQAISATG